MKFTIVVPLQVTAHSPVYQEELTDLLAIAWFDAISLTLVRRRIPCLRQGLGSERVTCDYIARS